MKKLLALFSVLALISGCKTAAESPYAAWGKAITMKINQSAVFADELVVTLKSIDDSRCAEGVQCIWAGELASTFEVSGPITTQEIQLGTSRTPDVSLEGYTFTLTDATESTATITVSKAE